MRGGLLTFLALATLLAGCAAEVELLEPIRVTVDGRGESADVDARAQPRREFHIEVRNETPAIAIDLQAERRGDERVVVDITVLDRDTNQTLARDRLVVEVTTAGGNATAGNQTGNATVSTGPGTANTTIDVDVRGKNNVVVLTQATEGSATVNVAARGKGMTQQG